MVAARKTTHQASAGSKQAILESVLSLAIEAGYEGTTMAAVARESGLPIGSVYWHFQNKEQLFVELLDYCFEVWKQSNPPGGRIRDRLRRSIASSAAASRNVADPAAAFWSIGLVFAFERRLVDNLARRRYIEIREEMYGLMVERLTVEFPELAGPEAREIAEDITRFGRAITDGFRASAAAGDDTDFERVAVLAADAMEHLIHSRVKELTHA